MQLLQWEAAMEPRNDTPPPDQGVPLIEGWVLGRVLYPFAMQEVARVPPANDPG